MYKQKSLIFGAVALVAAVLVVGYSSRYDSDTDSFSTQSLSFSCNDTARTGIPVPECEALVALYTSTNGPNRTNKNNWLKFGKPVSTWHGVTVSNGSVTHLDFRNNQLSGPIPAALGQLSNLIVFSSYKSKLSGPIPVELGQLTKLEVLWLNDNQLSGPIPAALGQLSNLKYLVLGDNQLSGPIPVELGQLTNLKGLGLNDNQFSGPIPVELGQLSNLTDLYLGDNQLSGPIPAELGQLTNLGQLSLNDNQLSGPIPVELGQLTNLKGLGLYNNQLSGPIPVELGQLTNLKQLRLYNNQLSGPIPAEIGQLTNLNQLQLYNNQLCGSIPSSIMNSIQPSGIERSNNNLLDDQTSYSPEMWNWLIANKFVDTNTNRIPDQQPEVCAPIEVPSGYFCDLDGDTFHGMSRTSDDPADVPHVTMHMVGNEQKFIYCEQNNCRYVSCQQEQGNDCDDTQQSITIPGSQCTQEDGTSGVLDGTCSCKKGVFCDIDKDSHRGNTIISTDPEDVPHVLEHIVGNEKKYVYCTDGYCTYVECSDMIGDDCYDDDPNRRICDGNTDTGGGNNACMSDADCPSGTMCQVATPGSCVSGQYGDFIFCTQSATSEAQCEGYVQPVGPNGEMVSVCVRQDPVAGGVCVPAGSTTSSTTTAGSTTSGSTTAGSTTSGTPTAGSTTSGSTTAGSTTSGSTTAGSTTSGSTTAGSTSSSSGTTGNFGATDGGSTDAGSTKGGSTDGGSTDGGVIKDTQEAVLFQDDSK